MAEAKRDGNFKTTLLGVSSVDLSTPTTIAVNPATGAILMGGTSLGTVTSVSVVSANGFAGSVATSTTTPAITLTTTITGVLKGNGTAISAATDGSDYLSSTTGLKLDQTSAQTIANDSPIFGVLTASQIVATDASKKLQSLAVATYPSLTELTYVKGVTSAIQTQINTKAPSTAPTFATSITGSYLTASEILITDGSKNIVSAGVATYPSLTELTYVKGVSSAIQTQINTKQATITFGTNVLTALGVNVGSAGAVVVLGGVLGTPSSGTGTNITGIPAANILAGSLGAGAYVITTTLQVGTGLIPDVDDGAYLGQAGTAFSDLFLAEGAVINWDSGDATITQTGNILAVAGADLRVATADVGTNADSVPTLSSTNTLTNKTLTSPTLTTPSAFTTGGNITLADSTSIVHNPAGLTDGEWIGETIVGVAGYAQTFGDFVYLAVADSRFEKTDADAAATAVGLVGVVVVAGGSDGAACTILTRGFINAATAFPTLTVGAPVYLDDATAGAVRVTIPTGADNVIRVVGFGWTGDILRVDISQDNQITVA